MTTPADYEACPGTGQPGIGTPSAFGNVKCSVCGRLVSASKTGKVKRHAERAFIHRERKEAGA